MSILIATVTLVITAVVACCDDLTPTVVVRVDDCPTSWRTPLPRLGGRSALQYARENSIPITWAVIVDYVDSGKSLTWQELRDYIDSVGGEAASHSYHHTEPASVEEGIYEVVASKAAIEAALPGHRCSTFIQPGTWYINTIDSFDMLETPIAQAIQSNYDQSQCYLGTDWTVGPVYYRHGMTYQFSLDKRRTWSIAEINGTLDAIVSTPGLMVEFQLHGVEPDSGSEPLRIGETLFAAFIDKIAALRAAGKIRLASISQAHARQLPATINRIPDPGFESCTPGPANPFGPWLFGSGARIDSSGGVGGSRYALMPDSASYVTSQYFAMPPGRYELSWMQKSVSLQPAAGSLTVSLENSGPPGHVAYTPSTIDWAGFRASLPGAWEPRKALFRIRESLPSARLSFRPDCIPGFALDDIRVTYAPCDPSISCSQVRVTPSPGRCAVAWRTPDDPQCVSVEVRIGAKTHPKARDEGWVLARVPAVPGAGEDVSIPLDWVNRHSLYFSVFAIRSDGANSPPEIVAVATDRTPPAAPTVTPTVVGSGVVEASWTASDVESGIAAYRYCVGATPGGSDTINWRLTQDTATRLEALPPGKITYLTLRAQNTFGFWSPSVTVPLYADWIENAAATPDGGEATVSGIVSAVYDDCCYIVGSSGIRGLKIVGLSGVDEGVGLRITGIMRTSDGERELVVH